jgi:tetratricopeptide (TPR) repeat protein
LKSAADQYRNLAKRDAANIPLRIEVAKANIRLGDTARLLREFDESEAAFERAFDQFNRLVVDSPENVEVQLQLANAKTRMAIIFDVTNRLDDAETFYEKAIADFETLTRKSVDKQKDGSIPDAYGRSLNSNAFLLADLGRHDEAIGLLRKAVQQFENAVALEDCQRFRRRVCSARIDLGQALVNIGENQEAEKSYRLAESDYQQLLEQAPKHPGLLNGLATAQVSLANALRYRGDAKVSAAYLSAIETFQYLVDQHPRTLEFREQLAIAQLSLAQFLHGVGDTLNSKEYATEALLNQIDLSESDETTASYVELGAAVSHTLGKVLSDLKENDLALQGFSDAIAFAERLTAAFPKNNQYHVRLAEYRTSLGTFQSKTNQHDEATKTLQQAAREFERLLALAPEDQPVGLGQAQNTVATARSEFAMGNLSAAKKELRIGNQTIRCAD